MDMWDKVQGTIILFLVLISSVSSEENCTIQKFTEVLETSLEANLWIKPESDFKRIEVHIKVRNILSTDSRPYYHDNDMAIKLDSILDSSYKADPYWILLVIKVYEKIVIEGRERLLLCASVNQTKTFQCGDKLLYSQFRYENYKLLAIGGLSFSRCNPSTFATDTPSVPNTSSDSLLSNGNSTRTDIEDMNKHIIYTDSQNKGIEPFMIVILVVVAILTVILIAAIIFVEWRSKIIERDIQYLSSLPPVVKGEDNMYFASPEGITMARPPPPSYSPTLPRKEII